MFCSRLLKLVSALKSTKDQIVSLNLDGEIHINLGI